MNVPLIVAGSLALDGAALHGGAGELLVLRKLAPGMLPSTRFGGPRMTKAMTSGHSPLTPIVFSTEPMPTSCRAM